MKQKLLLFLIWIGSWSLAWAQLPPGSIAPDFTATDINGDSHHLYELLDAGKTVYLDFSATWCGPCWSYHNTHALRDIWDMYGPSGTDEAYVMFIESDAATNLDCLYGLPTCVGGTQGNWVSGTPYPIIDDASIKNSYGINYYPTIYLICPDDKKIYETGQVGAAALWTKRSQYCAPPPIEFAVNSITNTRCYGSSTGAIDIAVTAGVPPFSYTWSNGAHTQDLFNVPAGVYTVTITSSNGIAQVFDQMEIEGPPSPLAVEVTEILPTGCNGVLGQISIEASGGWENFTYHWNNNQNSPTISGLTFGNYTVTVTDGGGCTTTQTASIAPPAVPVAIVAIPGVLTCAAPTTQLNGTASSSGPEYTYQWTASNGGNILSGSNTLTPVVNASGVYTLQVVNNENLCTAFTNVLVISNISLPSAEAGPVASVSCTAPTTSLQGSASTGAGISYSWTSFNGGQVVSGGSSLNPTVGAPGAYVLHVSNVNTGCNNTDTTFVSGANTAPSLSATSAPITCANASTNINTSTSAAHPVFAWTGPNGFVSTTQNPQVSAPGDYMVMVLDTVTNCETTGTFTVSANTVPPGASATGGAVTCTTASAMISGSSPDGTATFAWTGPNGFTSTQANSNVSDPGTYVLTVSSGINGCTSSATADVAANNLPPSASALAPSNLNCIHNDLQLDGTASAQGNNISYEWSTANGNIVSGASTQTPLVDMPGDYTILVSNSTTGCTNTASVTVSQSSPVTSLASVLANVSCNGAQNGSATASAAGGSNTYTYLWSNGATTATIENLDPGSYQVVATDSEGCTAASNVAITEPVVLLANVTSTPQTANGVEDGTATAAPTGGTPVYVYAWNNGASTEAISGLAPGAYTVTITDANGCTAVQVATVNSFNCAINASISSTNITCHGSANGSATALVVGAAEPVTYTWSQGATTQSVTNLAPGTYTVDILDASGCPATLSVSISQPAVLDPNASATGETAAGANNGTASTSVTGGVMPYAFAWSNGATTPSISGLSGGTYTVEVTDANGCIATETVTVSAFNCLLQANIAVANVNCAGAANGSLSVTLTGGSSPYHYNWSNGATTAAQTNVAPGVYTVTVVDDNGCETSQSATVTEPEALHLSVLSTTNVECPNSANGTANLELTGGVDPYVFGWSNGATGASVENLTAGTFTVTATDGNGCTSTTSVTIQSMDTQAPQILGATDQTLELDASGTATATMQSISVVATDNCSVSSITFNPSTFDCGQIGTHMVEVTVSDASGNTSTTVMQISVVDNIAPSLTCPSSIITCANENTVEYTAPVAVDNCISEGGTWDLSTGLPSGAEFPVGITTQTYAYTDLSGNTGTCSFNVEVTLPVEIGVLNVVNDHNAQGIGSIDISTAGVAPFTYQWTLAGNVVATTEDISNLTAGTYIVQVTDANGCAYSQSIVVGNTSATNEPSWLKQLQMRPNPASQLVHIDFSELIDQKLEIAVMDATGRKLIVEYVQGEMTMTINIASLPEGMYFVKFSNGLATGVRKLMIAR